MKYTKRKDGRYQSKIYLGQENGKKKYKFLYAASVKELEKKIREEKSLLEKGVNILEINDTLSEWINKYLPLKEVEISEKQYRELKNHLEYFNNRLGNIALKDISQGDIQLIINQLWKCNPTTKKETSKKTLQHYVQHLSQVFDFAISERVSTFNPCKYVKLPKEAPKRERRALTEEERRMIVEHPCPAAMLGLFSGLRKGEMTALLWSDIDLKNKTISVTKSFNFDENRTKEPKTKAGYRTVFIPDILVDYLATLERKSIYVLCNTQGNRLSKPVWESLWNKYLKELNSIYGIPSLIGKTDILTIYPFTIHELRHTFATILYEAGVPVLEAKNQLGHEDIQTTLAIYTHLDQVKGRNTLTLLNSFLKKSDGSQVGSQNTSSTL